MTAEQCLEQLKRALYSLTGELCREAKAAEVETISAFTFSYRGARKEAEADTLWRIRTRLIDTIDTYAPLDWDAVNTVEELEQRKEAIREQIKALEGDLARISKPRL